LSTSRFPSGVEELKKKLRIADGGDIFLFATTLADGKHVLVKTGNGFFPEL
jgi:hypothetical protein